MDLSLEAWEGWYRDHQSEILDDFFEFLRFQSIGAESGCSDQVRGCAEWLVRYLEAIGLEVSLWETSGHPVVFAQARSVEEDRPTLLIYHHYDVQPVDPLEQWESPPFEPTVRDGSVFARGAQDNKGQCFYTITALKALCGLCEALRFNIKLFIEGEEESGSVGTREVLKEHREELKSDAALAVDSHLFAEGVGAVTLGVRGIVTAEVEIRSAAVDMHSGSLGGIAYNPIRALARALSQCWDVEGRVAIPHFYDEVKELTEEEREALDLELSEDEMVRAFGLRALCPEPGYTIGQSASIRPTFEINGIEGGYTGAGFKTVLPAVARAKISCRLVPHQNPDTIAKDLEAHLRYHLPRGLELTWHLDQKAPAFWSSGDSMIAKRAITAYQEVLGVPCKRIISGGSIPIIAEMAPLIGRETIFMGFGLDSDQIHAPNEHFGLDRFKQGFLTMGRIFASFNG